jgi:hypothetical protein
MTSPIKVEGAPRSRTELPRVSERVKLSEDGLCGSEEEAPLTYTAEFRERGVRLYREHRSDYTSDNAAYWAVVSKIGLPLHYAGLVPARAVP